MTAARRNGEQKVVRRVMAKIPSALYVRLYSTKLYTGKPLEALLEEGITLVIAKYRLERDVSRDARDDDET